MERFAVLTNDLQYAAMNKHPERIEAVKKFLPHQIHFLKQARELSVPVIHLQLIKDGGEQNWHDRQFVRGAEGARIIDEVLDDSDIIVEKPKDSGFFHTNLDDVLKERNITTVIITGMQTQICVQTTAADAFFRGYKVIVPSDVVVSTKEMDTERALVWLEKYCARVLGSDQIIDLIQQEASLDQA
ncbi:isochorismatase family protein [Heliobacterium gestii]|uniref:Isochorismatase family protein n=1 Tax=Heliomicrobium gestii TaxID=2699 RepID=A0A845LAX0_HELGE|nr:isochorismatase family cysteine hydrolase [Heliomicrobium gestii]MBM7865558.1 nicotinamidase-related amidase [Heliomicrobium gestii]MZP41809.1 isochorismatase family protein [Heliomicrobium gestii]